MAGLGDEFRAAREARHLSLADVCEHIHIRTLYLQSIESEDWAALAAPVYARGFIRTYARFLGFDGEPAVAEYGRALGVTAHRPLEASLREPLRRRHSASLWVTTAVAACLVAFVSFTVVRLSQDGSLRPPAHLARATASASAAPSVARAAMEPQPASAAARVLELHLTQRAWLVVDVDGAPKLEGVYPAGTRRVFHGSSVRVRTGNAAGVDLTVNGKRLGPMGARGAVAERRITLGEE